MIGDIHGCCNTFRKMILEKIDILKTDEIYCLGDFIDRGPDSKGVIDFILKLRSEGYLVHTLRGNHEQMLLESEIDEFTKDLWMRNGGDKTLASFGIDSITQLKSSYLNFFDQTAYSFQTDDFILAHAGLNFQSRHPMLDYEAMLWIRNFTTDMQFLNGKILVHGHTPMRKNEILSQPFEGVINVDGGCVYKDKEGLGNLFALNFYERKFLEVKNMD